MMQKISEEKTSVAKFDKSECVSLQQVQEQLGIARATLYNYLAILRIDRHRFSFDRNTYILKSDLERVRRFQETREI